MDVEYIETVAKASFRDNTDTVAALPLNVLVVGLDVAEFLSREYEVLGACSTLGMGIAYKAVVSVDSLLFEVC